MNKKFLVLMLSMSIFTLSGCSVYEYFTGEDISFESTSTKKDNVSYYYSDNQKTAIVVLNDDCSDEKEQLTIIQDMLDKGYILNAVDSVYLESSNFDLISRTINMYFQKEN